MGLFTKKMSAKDIIEAIGALSDEDRESVRAFVFGESDAEPVTEETVAEPVENDEAPEEGSEADAPAEEPVEETAEEPSEDPSPEPAGEPEDAETPAEEPVIEQTEAADPVDTPEENGGAQADFDAILSRMSKLEEAVSAMSARLGEREDAERAEEDDPFGYAFGPEHKDEGGESDLEKAKREAGFNF